jgi:hypothetical protein
MKMSNKKFESWLRAYFRANPDVAEAVRQNDASLLDLPDEWKRDVERASAPEKRVAAREMADRAIRIHRERRRRAATAIAASCACLFIFFAFIPPGQTLAKGVVETVVKVFDDRVRVEMTGADSAPDQISPLKPREFDDFVEAAKYAKYPIIYIDDPSLKIESITVEASKEENTVTTIYSLPDKRQVVVYQDISEPSASVAVEFDTNDKYFKYQLFNGETMYCIDYDDGTYGGGAAWDNKLLGMMSENVPWDIMVKYVDHFAITG